MLMDDQYDTMTFVCTKTDNIEVSNTVNTLGSAEVCDRAGLTLDEFDALDKELFDLRTEEEKKTREYKQLRKQVRGNSRGA